MSRPLQALCALTLCVLTGCSATSGIRDQSDRGLPQDTRTSIPPSPPGSLAADRTPVLGFQTFVGHGGGWGTERPDVVSYEGSPTTTVLISRWRSWGKETAIGFGTVASHKPGGGYYSRDARAQLKATRLGMCDGRLSYRDLYIRWAPKPGHAITMGWRTWGTGRTPDICPSKGGGRL